MASTTHHDEGDDTLTVAETNGKPKPEPVDLTCPGARMTMGLKSE